MADTLVAIDESLKQNPNLNLAQLVYSYEYHMVQGMVMRASELQTKIIDIVKEDKMLPYYQQLATKFSWPLDQALVGSMK